MDMYLKVSQAREASKAKKQENLEAVRQRAQAMRQMMASPAASQAGQGMAGANIVNKDSIMLKRPYE